MKKRCGKRNVLRKFGCHERQLITSHFIRLSSSSRGPYHETGMMQFELIEAEIRGSEVSCRKLGVKKPRKMKCLDKVCVTSTRNCNFAFHQTFNFKSRSFKRNQNYAF